MNPQQTPAPGQPTIPTALDPALAAQQAQAAAMTVGMPTVNAVTPETVVPPGQQVVLPTVIVPTQLMSAQPLSVLAQQQAPTAPSAILSQPGVAAQQFPAGVPAAPASAVPTAAPAPVAAQAPAPAAQPAQPAQPVVKGNPNSTQNTLEIAEIRDGIVIMNDGSFRSVVMVKSINFDLMSQQEQEAVEYSYQSFLNSLYFPIQIFVRSQRVDLRPYLEKLDKIRTEHDNMLLALLMEDYIVYVDQLAAQSNIMDKKFYVVIPYFPNENAKTAALDQSKNFLSGLANLFNNKETHVTINETDLENAKNELRNRVQSLLSGLLQCGVQGLPLDTQELIELYYDSYNPDTATRQQLKDFNQLTADVVTKGVGSVPQQHLQRELQ